MKGIPIRYLWVSDPKIEEAIRKYFKDNRRKLRLIPGSFTGKNHPADEKDVEGLLRHISKVAWLIWRYKEEFKIPDAALNVLMASAFFHDMGTVETYTMDETLEVINDKKIVRKTILRRDHDEFLKHPKKSSAIAKKYLEAENVNPNIVKSVLEIIESHMSHWYPNFPQPKTELQKFFALADYVMTRKQLTWDFNINHKRNSK